MGRRYYCDYCDKSFLDDVDARKKHLISTHHIKLRKLHYEMCRDLRTLLKEESNKVQCRRFLQTGACQFTGNCMYTHYTQEELWNVKLQIEEIERTKSLMQQQPVEVPSVESWLQKYYERHNKQAEADTDYIKTSWTYPEQLMLRPDLPQSLQKFEPEHFTNSHFDEWGE